MSLNYKFLQFPRATYIFNLLTSIEDTEKKFQLIKTFCCVETLILLFSCTPYLLENINYSFCFIFSASYRIYASLSFAVLLLGVGVPLWWHTTAVLRVTLPYDGIAKLSNLDIKITTKILVAALTENRAKLLTEEIIQGFESAGTFMIQSYFIFIHSI